MIFRNAHAHTTLYLRLALGIGFLSAVADRVGFWGPPGTALVAWGNFHNFLRYTAVLNPWLPASWIPSAAWAATICEAALGIALILGVQTKLAALGSGVLTLLFAVAMVFTLGAKAPLNYSVFAFSAGAFLLARVGPYPWSVDSLMQASDGPVRSSTTKGSRDARHHGKWSSGNGPQEFRFERE